MKTFPVSFQGVFLVVFKSLNWHEVRRQGVEHHSADTLEQHRQVLYNEVPFKMRFTGEEVPFKMGELIDSTESVVTAPVDCGIDAAM